MNRGRPFVVHNTSGAGIGDSVSILYAACGLAAATGWPTAYCCHRPGWLAGVSHPNLTVTKYRRAGSDVGDDYHGELTAAVTGACPDRVQWYCDRASAFWQIPQFSGVRPAVVSRPEPVTGTGYELLVPFSSQAWKDWSPDGWRGLAEKLLAEGRRVVAVSPPGSDSRLRSVFGRPSGVECHSGNSDSWALAAVANAGRVWGNDSGLVHVAGLHGVPAVAVMTQLRPSFVFGPTAPSVVGVGADADLWPCQGCAWRGEKFERDCGGGCGALQSISAERVRSADVR